MGWAVFEAHVKDFLGEPLFDGMGRPVVGVGRSLALVSGRGSRSVLDSDWALGHWDTVTFKETLLAAGTGTWIGHFGGLARLA